MGKVIIRNVPMTREECITTAAALGLGTAEEVWEIVTQMRADEEERTHMFPNGNTLTLQRKRPA
jgi:hypothetical protein